MARDLDPGIADILRRYGEDPTDKRGVIWDCHGTWVVYHRALERVAARAGISFDKPDILRSERDEAVILVTARMDDRTDWDIGEALINVNYRVSGKQAAYVYAMAMKRARDRLILKMVGLHGLAYSEDESDEFKTNGVEPEPAPRQNRPTVSSGRAQPCADAPLVSAWVEQVERCTSRADLSFLFSSDEWKTAKPTISPEGKRLIQDVIYRRADTMPKADV